MFVSPVSNVHFCAEAPALNLERQGAYAKQDTQAAPASSQAEDKPKSHVVRNSLIGLAAAVVAVAVLHKTNVLKVLDEAALKDAKWYQKIGHYVSKAGEYICKYTYDPVANLCKKWFGKKPTVDPA